MPNLTGKLPMMGEDAFTDGFLSKSFGNKVISRINRPWKVVMPPGGGTGWVLESEENITLDLTKAKLKWDGTWNLATPPPYLPPWNLYPVGKGTLSIPFTYDSGTGTWTCTNTNHGLVLNSPVTIALTTAGGGTMASSFALATTYYARDTTDGTLKLAATAGGAAITGGTNGSGMTLVYYGLALKVNPQSTLMKTYNYRGIWKDSTWLDRYTPVVNFSNTFIITDHQHVIWMEVVFSYGEISTATIKSGAAWGSYAYVSADNSVNGSGSFTWYQLLGYLKLSSDPGGSANDAQFSSVWYKLMCPTTTHLTQGFLRQQDSRSTTPDDFIGIVPWFGCLWQGS